MRLCIKSSIYCSRIVLFKQNRHIFTLKFRNLLKSPVRRCLLIVFINSDFQSLATISQPIKNHQEQNGKKYCTWTGRTVKLPKIAKRHTKTVKYIYYEKQNVWEIFSSQILGILTPLFKKKNWMRCDWSVGRDWILWFNWHQLKWG